MKMYLTIPVFVLVLISFVNNAVAQSTECKKNFTKIDSALNAKAKIRERNAKLLQTPLHVLTTKKRSEDFKRYKQISKELYALDRAIKKSSDKLASCKKPDFCTANVDPVCAQKRFSCAKDSDFCAELHSESRTYSNLCEALKDGAAFSYFGRCF